MENTRLLVFKPVNVLGYCGNPFFIEKTHAEEDIQEKIKKTHALGKFKNWYFIEVNKNHISQRELFRKIN